MSERSASHCEAFGELTEDEETALDVLEDLHAEAESQDEKDAVNTVQGMIIG